VPTKSIAEEQLAAEFLELMATLRRELRRATAQPWPGRSLTGAQLELLRVVRREPGVSVNQAAETLRLAPNTISALVGQLVEAGLVRRARDERDRRVARLDLSAAARRTLEAWRDERALTLRRALGRLDSDDRDALEDALGPMARLAAVLDD
jgi:DNA-binding MarR family transcriptional regulator